MKPVQAKPFFVVSWYRPPSDPVEVFDKLEEVYKFLESEGKEIILLGDTYCDLSSLSPLEWPNSDVPICTKNILDIHNNSFALRQLITEHTRETLDTTTMIDHIAISNHSNVVESGVVKTCISDHCLVYVTRKFRGSIKANHKVIMSRQMTNFDTYLFISDLAETDWSAIVYNSDGLDNAVRLWSCHLSSIIEKHTLLREHRVTESFSPWISPWITPDLKQLFRTRDKMKFAAVKAKFELLMSAYRQMRCKANNLNSKMKRSYFQI